MEEEKEEEEEEDAEEEEEEEEERIEATLCSSLPRVDKCTTRNNARMRSALG